MVVHFLVYNNEQEAIDKNNSITQKCIDFNLWGDSLTNKYCVIKKHPNQQLWAVILDEKHKDLFTEEDVNNSVELTIDWFALQ